MVGRLLVVVRDVVVDVVVVGDESSAPSKFMGDHSSSSES
jgi:hypothetical protein